MILCSLVDVYWCHSEMSVTWLARDMWTPRGKLVIWCPFKPIFFKLLWPRTGPANTSEGACPNCWQFSEKFFPMQKPEFTSTIFPIIPTTSWCPSHVATPGSCPAGLTLRPALVGTLVPDNVVWHDRGQKPS
jgi:hypothetical protein